jgi:hypothetical protein
MLAVSSSHEKNNSSHQAELTAKKLIKVKNELDKGQLTIPYSNPLLMEIMLYDPLAHRVYPRQPDTIPVGLEQDYLRPNPVFMPLVFGLVKPVFQLQWKKEPATPLLLNSEATTHFLT